MRRAAVLLLMLVLGIALASPPAAAPELVRVKAKNLDDAYLLPGADFRAYSKVMIDPAEVAFHKSWMRNINNQQRSASARIDETDALEIAAAARSGFAEIWEKAFRKAGYEIVTAPGPEVLRLSPSIVDLYINAPDVMSAARARIR